MTQPQLEYIERLLLSSAIPPDVRRDAKRLLHQPEGIDVEQAIGLSTHLQHLIDTAPKREERPAEWRVRSYVEKVRWYGKNGRKPTIRPLAADLAWIKEYQRRKAEREGATR